MRAVLLCFAAVLLQAQPANPVFATYFGGGGHEVPGSVATDSEGNIYIAGRTDSKDFPVRNAIQPESRAFSQIFVTKFSPTGELVYSTYFGGSDNDSASAIATDRAGNVYVTGNLHSKDFPTRDAWQAGLAGGVDAFVLKLDPSGQVVYATYLGGRFNDLAVALAVDTHGSVYLTGMTESPDFPVTAAGMQIRPGGFSEGRTFRDAFVAKLDPAGKLAYSTFLGGSDSEFGWGIAVDREGQAHVAGETSSLDFPVGGNALQWYPGRSLNLGLGNSDGFLTKLKADGSGLVYSTYIGGPGPDTARAVTVDAEGRAYVTGQTSHARLPILRGPQWYLGGNVLSVREPGSNTFVPRRNGLMASEVNALAFDPNVAGLEYAGTADGMFRSEDGGLSWTFAGLDKLTIAALVADPARARTVYAGTSYGGGIFGSTDAGATWTSWNAGAPLDSRGAIFQALAIDPSEDGVLYAVAGSSGNSVGGSQPLFRITDSGATWTVLGQGLPTTPQALAAGPGSTLFAATRVFQFFGGAFGGGSTRIPGSVFRRSSNSWVASSIDDDFKALMFQGATLLAAGRQFYRSTDGGHSWIASALPPGRTVRQIAVDPRNPSTIYLIQDQDSTGALLRSTDGGETFETIDTRVAGAIAVNPFDSAVHLGSFTPSDGFVAGFEPEGGLFYSSFVGDGSAEVGDSIARDSNGNLYVAAFRSTSGYVTGAVGRTFVSRVDESGYSVDLGASSNSNILTMPCRAIAVAPDGAIVALMQATEPGLPVKGPMQQQRNGSTDLYVVKWYPQ